MSLSNLARIASTVEKYMLDAVTVVRPNTEAAVVNPVTLLLEATPTTVFAGKAMVTASGVPYASVLGGHHTSATIFEVGIPRDADPVLPNDLVTVTASVNNPDMIGMELYVTGEVMSTFFTHRRLQCTRRESAE